MSSARMRIACALVAVTAVGVAGSMASCAQTPPNVTLHSFQQPQKVGVVCIKVNDANGNAIAQPTPVAENQCVPVAAGASGATPPYHLYAVVTQTTPGAVAVVDLTAGNVVDVDRSTPGVDFIPVGATPTDVAVTRDGRFTFVSSADPSKLAIYAIDNTRLLGNSTGDSTQRPLALSELLSCALPQPPQALAVVPSNPSDGGSPGTNTLVLLLRAAAGMPAVVATIDPTSMAKGSLSPCTLLGATALSGQSAASPTPGPAWSDGVTYASVGDLRLQEPLPGPQCTPPVVDAGVADDAAGMAVGFGDAGSAEAAPNDAATSDAPNVASTPQLPHPTSMVLRSDTPLLYVADDAVPVIHVIDLHDLTSPREVDPLLATSVAEPTRRVAVGEMAISPATHDYKVFLYAIDARQGTLMVYEVTDPLASPHVPLERPHPELNPFAPLDRLSFSAPVAAVAFVRHDWSLPSKVEVDAIHQYTGVLCNPNPNAYPDAGVFADRGAYYRADQAALIESMVTNGGTVQTLPSRLRGVFGFATLSNGAVVTIDVDDWDAPCRRPDRMASGSMTGVLDFPQPDPGPGDLDPYHAPFTNSAPPHSPAVSLEAFFPVSAPHRLRSAFLLRSDSVVGIHVPNVVGVPQLFSATGAPVPMSGVGGSTSPVLSPAPLPPGFVDPSSVSLATGTIADGGAALDGGSDGGDGAPPNVDPTHSLPGIRVSFDDPTTHQDQDWAVTYEGALPTVSGIAANITSTSSDPVAYQTLTLSAPGAQFCARGVEDWSIGQSRANQVVSEIRRAFKDPASMVMTNLGPFAPTLPQWTSDYVEISDDLLPASDPYWSEPSGASPDQNDCWDGALADKPDIGTAPSPLAQDRYNACQQTFGAATDADTHLLRDLPILHAHDDSLEVGRFGWFPGPVAVADAGNPDAGPNGNLTHEETTNRVVVGGDPSNVPFLRLTRCCFHHQAAFKVRAGGQWLAVGSSVGLLHHVKADATGACVLSCEPRATLLNARAFDIPWWSPDPKKPDPMKPVCSGVQLPSFDRDSPLVMRNPMFSFVMWAGCPGSTPPTHDHTLSTRDLTWRFSMRGGFAPLTVQLTSPTTGNAVSPQSMRFIGPLGQLAVVDGESQGLVLIDLNLLAVVHNYF